MEYRRLGTSGLKVSALSLGVDRAALALAWALHKPGISSAITGTTRVSQVESNLVRSISSSTRPCWPKSRRQSGHSAYTVYTGAAGLLRPLQ